MFRSSYTITILHNVVFRNERQSDKLNTFYIYIYVCVCVCVLHRIEENCSNSMGLGVSFVVVLVVISYTADS